MTLAVAALLLFTIARRSFHRVERWFAGGFAWVALAALLYACGRLFGLR